MAESPGVVGNMSIQEFIEDCQRKMLERNLESGIKVAELAEQQASWEMLAAFHKAEQARQEKLASARTHEKLARQVSNVIRPSATMRPELREEGDEWLAGYYGCVGRGPTPETACQDFDDKWVGKDEA